MAPINIHAAKTNFSQLVDKAAAGEEIIIAKAGVPVARLMPLVTPEKTKRPLGLLAKKLAGREIPKEFYEPLPDDIVDLMYNGPIFPDEKP